MFKPIFRSHVRGADKKPSIFGPPSDQQDRIYDKIRIMKNYYTKVCH